MGSGTALTQDVGGGQRGRQGNDADGSDEARAASEKGIGAAGGDFLIRGGVGVGCGFGIRLGISGCLGGGS